MNVSCRKFIHSFNKFNIIYFLPICVTNSEFPRMSLVYLLPPPPPPPTIMSALKKELTQELPRTTFSELSPCHLKTHEAALEHKSSRSDAVLSPFIILWRQSRSR